MSPTGVLAQSARDLYHANGFEHTGQEAGVSVVSGIYQTIQAPPGREKRNGATLPPGLSACARSVRRVDAHQAFEEIRGVIAAAAEGVLSHEVIASF